MFDVAPRIKLMVAWLLLIVLAQKAEEILRKISVAVTQTTSTENNFAFDRSSEVQGISITLKQSVETLQ